MFQNISKTLTNVDGVTLDIMYKNRCYNNGIAIDIRYNVIFIEK